MNNKNKNAEYQSGICRARIVAGVLLLAPVLAFAAPWEFSMRAEGGVIHTDNLFLAPEEAAESDTVYTLVPEFALEKDSERLEATLIYRPEAYWYSDFSEADDVFHVADAMLNADLIRDRLFLYLTGVHFQSIETPEAAIPTSNVPVSANRIDSTILEARPSWQQPIGNAELLVEAGIRDLQYDEDDFDATNVLGAAVNQSTRENYGTLNVNNFSQEEGLAWGLYYNYRRMEYEISPPFEFQRASLNIGFWVSNALRIFGVGGAETSFDDIFEANLDDDFWEAGFSYRPNQRLSMEIAAGERSYGTSMRASFDYTLRRGSISLNYDEGPTSRAETIFGSRPVETDRLDNLLERPGNADRFVRKRGEVSANLDLARSDFSLRVFFEERQNRTSALGDPLLDESLSGVALRWNWEFGSKTTLVVGSDYGKRDVGLTDDDLLRTRLGIAYELSPRTTLRAEVSRAEQEGNQTNEFDYVENQGRLTLEVELL